MSAADPVLKALGRRVRELRVARGWSQERLADEAGLDRSYMSGVERGVRNISVLRLAEIASALRVSLSALFPQGKES